MFSTIITSHRPPPFERPWGNYLLEKIVENQAPEEISWLPQTVGWKILAIIIIFYFFKKSYQAYRNYQRNAYRRDAIKWLAQCQQSDELDNFKQLPALIRKTALFAFSRTDISQLSGKQWEQWLDKQCKETNFTGLCPNLLHQLAYSPVNSSTFDKETYKVLISQIALWIKHHRRLDDEL